MNRRGYKKGGNSGNMGVWNILEKAWEIIRRSSSPVSSFFLYALLSLFSILVVQRDIYTQILRSKAQLFYIFCHDIFWFLSITEQYIVRLRRIECEILKIRKMGCNIAELGTSGIRGLAEIDSGINGSSLEGVTDLVKETWN
jgi:hypothetical protein